MMVDYTIYHFDYSIAPVVLGAIISGISALASSVASGVSAKRQQRRQNQMNMEMANYQNSINLEQWNKENEYNSPINQMQRLKDAGVNPRIWWSNGTNTSASSPTLSAPEQQYTAVGGEIARGLSDAFGSAVNAVNQMNQIKMQEEQMELIKAQTRHYDMLANLNSVTSNLRQTESLMKAIDLNYRDLDNRQRVYGKQLLMNNMLGDYLSKYGNSLITNQHGLLSVDLSSPIWNETPMTSLIRKNYASSIALADAKKLETFANIRSKNIGVEWLKKRMVTEQIKQGLLRTADFLTYHKKENELTRGNIMRTQQSLMETQLKFMEEQIKKKKWENFNYLPFLGDISEYPQLLLKPTKY